MSDTPRTDAYGEKPLGYAGDDEAVWKTISGWGDLCRTLERERNHWFERAQKLMTDQDPTAREHALQMESAKRSARIATLEDALREIVNMDARSIYERCPDCDYPDECQPLKRCHYGPSSYIGERARAALSANPPEMKL